MKKILFLVFSFLLLNSTGFAQFKQNSFEGSVLINLGLINVDRGSNEEVNSYFQINIMPAYYVLDNLSVETEFVALVVGKDTPEFNFIGNLSYTRRIKKTGFAPYARIGYGISNSLPSGGSAFNRNYKLEGFESGVFNSGLGLKFLVSDKFAFRGELNYKIYTKKITFQTIGQELSGIGPVHKVSLLFGTSFLF